MSPLTRQIRLVLASAVALLSLAGCNLQFSNQAEARDEWKKSYTLASGGTLEIRNTNGLIDVQPTDGTTVEVTAERIVRASTDQTAKDALAQLEIHEEVSPNKVTLDSAMHLAGMNILFGGSREVRYHVHAPRNTNVYLVSTNGKITANDLSGSFHAETTNGEIIARGISGEANAETTNGGVTLEMTKVGDRGVTCSTTNGEIALTIPQDTKARLSAQVTNGGIDTSNLTLGDLDKSRRRLDATINGGGPSIRLETTNGGISVKGR